MRVKSGYPAITIDGGATVIRDSIIETDLHTAILLFGPKAVIENNTIIVRNNRDPLGKNRTMHPRDPQSAAIRLRDADGAIVRNNKIYIATGDQRSAQAITLENSRNVLLEGNQVFSQSNLPLWQAYDSVDAESDTFNAQAPDAPHPARIHTTVTERGNTSNTGFRHRFGPVGIGREKKI